MKGSFAGQGEWAGPDQVLMVVEVTAYDTDKRDREEKPSAYAQTGIPIYLLIDRESCETLVYSEPSGHAYAQLTRRPFGKTHRTARTRRVLPGHRSLEGLGALTRRRPALHPPPEQGGRRRSPARGSQFTRAV